MLIGDRIAKRRKELGMTQDELAAKTGYKSKAAISKIETNVNDITQSMVVRFAEALDTSVAYLMGWEDLKHAQSSPEKEIEDEKYELLNMLFHELSPDVQDMIIAQLQGLVRSQRDRGDPSEL